MFAEAIKQMAGRKLRKGGCGKMHSRIIQIETSPISSMIMADDYSDAVEFLKGYSKPGLFN